MASNLPISKTNVVSLIACENTYATAPTTPSVSKRLAFNANSLARQQTLTPNPELRGSRMQGALVVGPKNPGGPFQGYQTDQTLVMFYEALLGKRVTTELNAIGLTVSAALAGAGAGNVDGAVTYKIVITKGSLGITLPSAVSNSVTAVAGSNGKVNVARTGGTLPSGWTWNIYRTAGGGAPPWKLLNPAPLGAAVTSYLDNIADGSLGADAPSASTAGDYQHIITVGDTLPSYTVERALPYPGDTIQFIRALGAKCDTGKIDMKSTGYFDLQTNWLQQSTVTEDASFDSGTPSDWRFGEKVHQAMVTGSGAVQLGDAGGALSDFLKFQNVTFDHNNNLDKTDYPLGLAGDRGSLAELQAISTVSGSLKISDRDALDLIQSAPQLKTIAILHSLATYGHSLKHEFFGCQFDPMDPPVSGQGILVANFTAHAVQEPDSLLQVRVTIVNGEPADSYDPHA